MEEKAGAVQLSKALVRPMRGKMMGAHQAGEEQEQRPKACRPEQAKVVKEIPSFCLGETGCLRHNEVISSHALWIRG